MAVLSVCVCVFQFQGGVWTLSTGICDGLMTMDVMLCTASIFNLCAISIDRSVLTCAGAHHAIHPVSRHRFK